MTGAKPVLPEPLRILAIDVGAGTQDILVYESDRTLENCVKLILPAQTQIVARRIQAATAAGQPVFLAGRVMGGGATSSAVELHLRANLPVFAAPEAARTLHNDLERVANLGVQLTETPPPGAVTIWCQDVDLNALETALGQFGVEMPRLCAIAVQDHGYLPGAGGREFRYEFLQQLLSAGGAIQSMIFREPPAYMLRMRALSEAVPGVAIMDTGSAAVLGIMGDPVVARATTTSGAILVNIGNLHTFAVAVHGRQIVGWFEHHTGGITPDILSRLVTQLQQGTLTHQEVVAHGGHGAAFSPDYRPTGGFNLVAITGPNRGLARSLGYYEAVPHGDMMLSGPFGLVEGLLRLLEREGYEVPYSLMPG